MGEIVSFLIMAIIVLAAFAALFFLLKRKKNARWDCRGACGGCAMSGLCHSKKPDEDSDEIK